VPSKVLTGANRLKSRRYAEPDTLPERPDLRNNFAGRMRAALGWFSHLAPLMRRSILIKGLIAAAVAFVIGMGAVYVVEKGIGNSLSCGLWGKCPDGAEPGIHLLGGKDTGAGSSLSLGRAKTKAASGYENQSPDYQQNQAPDYQQNVLPQDQNVLQQEGRSYRQEGPTFRQPADSGVERRRGLFEPDQPVEPRVPAQQEKPSSASPAPGEEETPAQEIAPSDASPAPSD
jgi:hypothetical protein